MSDYYVAICMTVKAESEQDAVKKLQEWWGKQGVPKWIVDHEVSDAQEAKA
jgi:hypothetical protein